MMKDNFKSLPYALQKQIIKWIGASVLSLLLFILTLAVYGDIYLSLAFVLFFVFFSVSGIYLFIQAISGKVIAIKGECTEVEQTVIRKRPKTVFFSSGTYTVKVQVRKRLKHIAVGDKLVVYVSEKTPVYQNEGCQIISAYHTIEIMKGGS